jgi:hypothetical protein
LQGRYYSYARKILKSSNSREAPMETVTETGLEKKYITMSNWNKVLKRIDVLGELDKELYFGDLSRILSGRELRFLAKAKKALQNVDFASDVHIRMKTKEDTKTWAFEGGSSSYHSSSSCPRLVANYVNLEIPPEIKHKGDAAIAKFRDFCKQHKAQLEEDEPRFRIRLEANFILRTPPQKIYKDNSGSEEQLNLDLAECETRIDKLLRDAEKFRGIEGNEKIIKDKGYGTDRCKEALQEGSILYIWHNNYKSTLKSYLITYFRVKFNPDLSFEGKLLASLGFSPCHSCH